MVAGTDGIHLKLIKYGGNKLLNRIYELIRQIWEEERIHEKWKETIIVSIYIKNQIEIGVRIKREQHQEMYFTKFWRIKFLKKN